MHTGPSVFGHEDAATLVTPMAAVQSVAELQAALDRAEYKRRELAEPRPTHFSESEKLLTILPNAAELYRRQITLGLDGTHPQIMLKARLAVRELLGNSGSNRAQMA